MPEETFTKRSMPPNPMDDIKSKLDSIAKGLPPEPAAAPPPQAVPDKPAAPPAQEPQAPAPAEKKTDQPPEQKEPKTDPLLPKIDPESLEFVPKNAQQWRDAKGRFQTQIGALEQELKDAKAAADLLREMGGADQVKALKQERDELKQQFRTTLAGNDPDLKRRHEAAKKRVIDELRLNVRGTSAEALVEAIERHGEASVPHVRKFLAENPEVDPFLARNLVDSVADLQKLERDRRALIEEAVANWDSNIQAHESQQRAQMEQARRNLEAAFTSELESYKSHPFLSDDNAGERIKVAKAVLSGTLPPAEMSRMALMGAVYPATAELANKLSEENAALKARLAKIEGNAPGAGARGGEPGIGNDGAADELPDPRKAGFKEMSAGQMLGRRIRQMGL